MTERRLIDTKSDPFPGVSMAGHRVAAPSWVMHGALAENCRFLAGRVQEVGLLFFESAACLAYDGKDLPADLAELPLSWHVHLPLDLPWDTPGAVADTCLALMEKIAYLGVRRVVLHPPQPGLTMHEGASVQAVEDALTHFAGRWRDAGFSPRDCMLENVRHADLVDIWPVVQALDFSVCLDTGHVMAYRQERLLGLSGLAQRVRMVHLNAPGPGGRHLPLTSLSDTGKAQLADMVRLVAKGAPDAVFMMEIFDWAGIEASVPVVRGMLPLCPCPDAVAEQGEGR